MLDVNHLCPGCMGRWEDTEKPCPRCGFSWETAPAGGRELPIFTILAGRYLLGRRIGVGGFGIIYLAMDLAEERVTAIKEFFPASLASREGLEVAALPGEEGRYFREALRSFHKEADLLSRFADVPGIVRYRDYVMENGTAYLVMDYIEGTNLRRYMRETGKTFTQEEALGLMRPILLAVDAMHRKNVLHRDISPENLIRKPDGTLTLIDFGAAREFSLDEEENLTVILKHGYAPEEQYHSGSRQGPWTDLYACCAVFYQMVSGIQPQDAAARARKDDLLTLDEIEGVQVTERFARIIEKGMTIHATERYASIRALMAELYGDCAEQPEQNEEMLPDGQGTGEENIGEQRSDKAFSVVTPEIQTEKEVKAEQEQPAPSLDAAFSTEKKVTDGVNASGSRGPSGKKGMMIAAAAAVLVVTVVLFAFRVIPLGGSGSGGESEKDEAFAEDEISAEISAETSFEQEDGLVWLVTGKEDISYDIPVWYRFEYNEHGVWEKITTSNVLEHSYIYSGDYFMTDISAGIIENNFQYKYDRYGRITSVTESTSEGNEYLCQFTYWNNSTAIPKTMQWSDSVSTISINMEEWLSGLETAEKNSVVKTLLQADPPGLAGDGADEYWNAVEVGDTYFSYAEYEVRDGIYTPTGRTSGTLPGAAAEAEEGNASQTAEMAEVEEADPAAASDAGAASSALDEETQRALIDLLESYGVVGDSLTYPVHYAGEEALWEALEAGIIDYVLGGRVAGLDELPEGYCAVLPPEDWFPDTHTADTIITRDMDTCMRITLLLLEEGYYEGDRAYEFLSDFEGDWEPGDSIAVQTDNALRYELALQYLEYWGEETENSWAITDTESGQSAGDNNIFFE